MSEILPETINSYQSVLHGISKEFIAVSKLFIISKISDKVNFLTEILSPYPFQEHTPYYINLHTAGVRYPDWEINVNDILFTVRKKHLPRYTSNDSDLIKLISKLTKKETYIKNSFLTHAFEIAIAVKINNSEYIDFVTVKEPYSSIYHISC